MRFSFCLRILLAWTLFQIPLAGSGTLATNKTAVFAINGWDPQKDAAQ